MIHSIASNLSHPPLCFIYKANPNHSWLITFIGFLIRAVLTFSRKSKIAFTVIRFFKVNMIDTYFRFVNNFHNQPMLRKHPSIIICIHIPRGINWPYKWWYFFIIFQIYFKSSSVKTFSNNISIIEIIFISTEQICASIIKWIPIFMLYSKFMPRH